MSHILSAIKVGIACGVYDFPGMYENYLRFIWQLYEDPKKTKEVKEEFVNLLRESSGYPHDPIEKISIEEIDEYFLKMRNTLFKKK